MSQTRGPGNDASAPVMTEAQRSKLLALFAAAKQQNLSGPEVQKQIGAILSPAQQRALMTFLNAGTAARPGAGEPPATEPSVIPEAPQRRWTA